MGPIRLFGSCISCALVTVVCLTASSAFSQAPQPSRTDSKITLDTSEVLFSVLASINMCGYDQDLPNADPLRNQVRAEIAERLQASSAAAADRERLCQFYRDKQQADASRDLAQYVSLALNLGPPPDFAPTLKEADMPPDAANLLGFIPLLQQFYSSAGLNSIWNKHQAEYEQQIARLQAPVMQMILNSDLYLKMPISGYLGRKFVVYVEPLGAASQVNARNYGTDYFLVASPASGSLKMDQIRHTYLHFILDPLVQKRANQLKRLDPILELAKAAPVDESYKHDSSLMVIESLIRAIEARTVSLPAGNKDAKALEALRRRSAQESMEQGYVLTQYFHDALVPFENEPTGLKDAFGPLLVGVDLGRERKRISEINFATQAAPELVRASKMRRPQMLDLAEQRLAMRDPEGAQQIAQQVLDQKTEDQGRALFILARSATLKRDVNGARVLFERALEVSHDPRILAWSHISLARILDLMCNRDGALSHYKAAALAGDTSADTKAAADKGVQELPPGCEKED